MVKTSMKLGLLVACLVCLNAGSAHATALTYWSGNLGPGAQASGPRHTIYSNYGQTYAGSQYVVGVYARENDGSMAGSVAWGNGTTSHSYCACALRYPYLVNGEPWLTMNMIGIESY